MSAQRLHAWKKRILDNDDDNDDHNEDDHDDVDDDVDGDHDHDDDVHGLDDICAPDLKRFWYRSRNRSQAAATAQSELGTAD
jgi:ABC-type Zn2+ transport system substrate-binding protein/surface adhesin